MAEKAARKKPVRTAPARSDYPSEVAWLEAKLAHAQAQEAQAATARIDRVNKRISAKQAQIAKLTTELGELEAQRDKLNGLIMSDPESVDEV